MSSAPTSQSNDEGFWLFGYGSLIWKPPPDFNGQPSYDRRLPGHVRGYVRRFWQASEDHRGTPTHPGRVVTLISHAHWLTCHERVPPDEDQAIVHGAAYHIPPSQAQAVLAYLDVREMGGYSVERTVFYPALCSSSSSASGAGAGGGGGGGVDGRGERAREDTEQGRIEDVTVYIGLPTNPQFLGCQPVEDVARVIARAEGPSGRNEEYLFMLAEGLEGLGVGRGEDGHVRDLVGRVRALSGGKGKGGGR